ncbi:Sodium/potassium/calcium exchanger 6 [Monoraphidium neglectum]|uniref:Sodium/potassium/calcium exchanger 6 n=1 Tax=Monoraphidium neglectum TaxID=145388 RepID=A0A0D2M8P7_9CHLO|nr:Sodium/potassium/calcium exchanger 6 [Monoraphidium neglectum]KIY97451.1 Sodium/potassium/calcium exchanger 6 [Monoraphidium neglectum]|eukprot:XP_013896471.1 Sodium/potassium/calcium exchanger 6 [Monoraphidium neglectum]
MGGTRWASLLVLLLALIITFGFLLTAAERFFCPALEIIAEYLRMPPAVAGATLLSFGNGAPDLDLPAIGMALSEPVGGGLFTSNIVFAAVVLLSTRNQALQVHKALLLKDLLFYLLALVTILVAISDSKVEWYEAVALALSYVAYVAATAWLARADEPVHLEAARHEVPPADAYYLESESQAGDPRERDEESGGRGDSAFDEALRRPLLEGAGGADAPVNGGGGGLANGGGARKGGGGGGHGGGTAGAAGPAVSSGGSWSGFAGPPPEAAPTVVAAVAAANAQQAAGGGGDPAHPDSRGAAQRAAAAAILSRGGGGGGSGGLGGGSGQETPGSTPRWSVGGTPKAKGAHRHAKRPLKRQLQQPFMQLMKWTMPKIGLPPKYQYPRSRAALLPLTAPLLILCIDPAISRAVTWGGVAWAAGTGLMASAMIWAMYPEDNIPKSPLKGVFAVLSFGLSMVWLKLSADTVVHICMVLGIIFGAPPALLGATVLAWGNSMPDMANNLSLARDGYPTMAITACFAAPLFTLLVGTSSAMAYGALTSGGVLAVPFDKMLAVMYGFAIANLCKFCLLIPLVHKWVLGPGLAITALAFYFVYTVIYCLAVADAI